MKKTREYGFAVTITVILSALGAVYYHTANSPSYVEHDPVLNSMVERKIELINLQTKLQQIEQSTQRAERSPAAVRPHGLQSEFEVDSISGEAFAEAQYQLLRKSCYEAGQELECVNTIERVVTHFPESKWAAESLVVLTDYYYRTKRMAQAHELVAILKKDFRHLPEIQDKVKIIEKVIN